jgi:hypothetical protein
VSLYAVIYTRYQNSGANVVILTDFEFVAVQRFIAVQDFDCLWRSHRAASMSHDYD